MALSRNFSAVLSKPSESTGKAKTETRWASVQNKTTSKENAEESMANEQNVRRELSKAQRQ